MERGKRVVDKITEALNEHLKAKPRMVEKRGRRLIEISVNESAPLSKLLESINHACYYAERTSKPTRIKVSTNVGQKTLYFTIPVATKGIKDGRPIYPYFDLVKKALYIAPGYPRKNSPNMREIVGQLVAANAVSPPISTENVRKHSYSDVEIQLARGCNKYITYTSDIDNIHITEMDMGRWKTYTISPVEVITRSDRLAHKIRGWEHLIHALKKFGKNEGADIEVKPVVVHVETDGAENKKVDVGELLGKKFQNYKVLQLKSKAWVEEDSSRRGLEKWNVEYMGGALRNVATLPKRFQSELTSAVVSNHSNIDRLKELFREMAALRKIWATEKIPPNVKNTLTNKYTKLIRQGEEKSLLKAFHETRNNIAHGEDVIETVVRKTYKE